MLYKSGVNLFPGALNFISESSEITLLCAYIRTEQLKILNKEKKIKQIVVRWEIRDLHQGASDLDLYEYCVKNDIVLYRNTRIHLKCMLNDKSDIFLGSANITGRGIGEAANSYNYELNAVQKDISFKDINYLDKIIFQSQYVSEELFNEIKEKVDSLVDFNKQEQEYKQKEVDKKKKKEDYFLISQLPTFNKVESLYEAAWNVSGLTTHEKKCISHDLAIYDIDINQNREDFHNSLKEAFNSHPFILSFKQRIINEAEQKMRYGLVLQWIKNKTTTVPTPVPWELKKDQVVNTLYNWVCFFDPNFKWHVPGDRSQVIYYKN